MLHLPQVADGESFGLAQANRRMTDNQLWHVMVKQCHVTYSKCKQVAFLLFI